MHRELPNVARGPQHDANPDQIVHDRRGARAVRPTAANVANQRRGSELQGVYLADGVALEELEMALLASLPFGNRLEGLDVPADEGREADGPVLLAAWYGLVFELTSRCLAQARPPSECMNVLASRWTIILSKRFRTIAV